MTLAGGTLGSDRLWYLSVQFLELEILKNCTSNNALKFIDGITWSKPKLRAQEDDGVKYNRRGLHLLENNNCLARKLKFYTFAKIKQE